MENIEALAQEQEQESKEEKKTQAQILVGLASDFDLFYDDQSTAYARIAVNGHYEVWAIRSSDVKLILVGRYLEHFEDRVPGSQALSDALMALEAKARLKGTKRNVHIRVAETDEAIYLDLCNENWQVVEIKKEGWKVIDHSPVYFKRSNNMGSLPAPMPDGSVNDLRRFINFKDEPDYKLIIAWLLSTFRENSPYPILNIQGEQGSSKSTTTKVLRTIIDPSSLPLRALPRDEKDLVIAANNTHILAFDNLSGLPADMSDALAKVSTGGGLATRKLYSDNEESVFQVMRPMILNGIDDISAKPDLLDRSIILNLPSIPEDQRKDEKTFKREFEAHRASILGGLCTVVAGALKALPHTKLSKAPRMADFALFVTAAEKALSWEENEFINIYNENRETAVDQGIESDPFATAILELMKRTDEFEGNATQLLSEAARYVDERTRRSKAFPTSRSVRNRLRRINPSLKKKNILYIEWESRKFKTLKLVAIKDGDDNATTGDDKNNTSAPHKGDYINAGDDRLRSDDNFPTLSKEEKEDLLI